MAVALLLGLIVLFGFYLRTRYLILAGGLEAEYKDWSWTNHYGSIGEVYLQNAHYIYNGEWSAIYRGYTPGYSALIALVKLAGIADPQLYRVVQVGLDACACFLAYAVIRKLGAGQVAAMVGAFAYAIFPEWAWSSTLIMGEALLPALTLAALLILLQIAPRNAGAVWFLAGLGLGVLPLFRPEMTLFFMALVLWALLQGGSSWSRRVGLAMAAFVGFMIPWNVIAAFNYWTHGQYFLTDNISGYVLAAGLGQIPNPYGYFADDQRAIAVLNSLGIGYRSPAAESYWKSVYWNAWQEHPWHVIATIRYRLNMILSNSDIRYDPFFALDVLIRHGPILLFLGSLVLIVRRQYASILLVVGPLFYAMATNGLMYSELRYVRYAHVSYLLGGSLALDGLLALSYRLAHRYLPVRSAVRVPSILAIAAAGACLVWVGQQTYALAKAAERTTIGVASRGFASALNNEVPVIGRWRPAVPGAAVTQQDGKTVIAASSTMRGYQASTEIRLPNASGSQLKYDIAVKGSEAYIGLLTRDEQVLLESTALAGNAHHSGRLFIPPYGSVFHLIISHYSSDPSEITIDSLRYVPLCAEPRPEVANSLFRRLRSVLFPAAQDWIESTCPS